MLSKFLNVVSTLNWSEAKEPCSESVRISVGKGPTCKRTTMRSFLAVFSKLCCTSSPCALPPSSRALHVKGLSFSTGFKLTSCARAHHEHQCRVFRAAMCHFSPAVGLSTYQQKDVTWAHSIIPRYKRETKAIARCIVKCFS